MSHGRDIHALVKALDGDDDSAEPIKPAKGFCPVALHGRVERHRSVPGLGESGRHITELCLIVAVDDPSLPGLVRLVHDIDGEINLGRGPLDNPRPREEESLNARVSARFAAELDPQLGNSVR